MNTFDPEQHLYRSSTARLPGATDVIKSEGLVNPMWMSEDARWRGKCVHRGVELLVKGELDWFTVDEMVAGYLRSFKQFLDVTGFIVIGAETPCFDSGFACMPDIWGILNSTNALVELKTGVIPKWAAIQTALQKRALKTEFGFNVHKRFALRLMPDGSLAKLQLFDNDRDEHRALSMVDSFHWKAENGYVEGWR